MVKGEIIVAASPNGYMKMTRGNDLKFGFLSVAQRGTQSDPLRK